MRGSIIPPIIPQLIVAGLVAVIGNILRIYVDNEKLPDFSFTPFTTLGVGISIFLGFRNNACYDRWWEGRNLWGKQIIVVRNLGKLLSALDENGFGWNILRLGVAQTHALRGLLRPSEGANHDRNRFLTKEQLERVHLSPNIPNSILQLACEETLALVKVGKLDSYSRIAITNTLAELGHVQGGCERLSNTPLPFPYSLLVHRTAYLYILLAPFAMAEIIGWWAVPFNIIVAYTFFGLDELAHQLEHPFKDQQHCLALSAISRSIERTSMDCMGEVPPPALSPTKNLLM